MKKLIVFLLLTLFIKISIAQKVKNEFFAFHNIIRGDSIYNTFDKQVELIKNAGFDAIEINQIDSFEGMKAALDKYQFKGAYFYVKIKLEQPYLDQRLEKYIQQLKGTKTIIAPYVVSESKKFSPSSHNADTLVIRLIKQIGKWSKNSDLQVAIYPHLGFYVERTDQALALVKEINMKNVGLSFNLCHWLATTSSNERLELKQHLKTLFPYLKMISISGANDLVTKQKNIWDDYILPLGQGSFDTFNLVKFMVKDLKYKNPIGVQCYNIKGSKTVLINSTIQAWNARNAQLYQQK